MIEIKNISKTFKNNKVLDGIDLTINQGDVVAMWMKRQPAISD